MIIKIIKWYILAMALIDLFKFGGAGIAEVKLDSDEQIPLCMVKLSEKYFEPEKAGSTSLILIGILQVPKYNQRIVLKEIFGSRAYFMTIMMKNSKLRHRDASHFKGKAQGYIYMITAAQELHSHIKLVYNLPTWNPNAITLVLLMEQIKNETALDIEIRSSLDITFSYGMLDVNVIYQHPKSDNIVQSKTWFPYENSGCAKTVNQIRIIDQCEWKTLKEEFDFESFFPSLYPKIPDKFHNCPLKITAVVNEPYIFDANLTKKNGAEYNLFAAIADQMKLKPLFNVLPDSFALSVYSNDSRNGFYSSILKGDSNIMIGGLYESSVSRKVLSSSVAYYQDDFTWCVQKSPQTEKWKNVFIIFDYSVWILTIATIFIVTIVLTWMIKLDRNRNENFAWSFLISISFVTNNQTEFWPKRLCLRIFVVSVAFFSINIGSAYRSSLINFLTNPTYEYQISTIEEAVKLDYTFVGGENTLEFLLDQKDEIGRFIASTFKPVTNLDDALMELKNNSRLAVAVPRGRKANTHLPLTDYDIFCFETRNNIYTYPIVMMAKKNYHLLPKINKMLREMAQAGLLTRFRKDSYRLIQNDDDIIDEKQTGSMEHPILTLAHVQGAFYLGLLGIIFALVVFLLEWAFYLIGRYSGQLWFIKYFEQYFCFTHASHKRNSDRSISECKSN